MVHHWFNQPMGNVSRLGAEPGASARVVEPTA